MREEEFLVDIAFPALPSDAKSTFIKLGLRRAQAISVINVAVIVELDQAKVRKASITLGAVAPTIIHAEGAEDFLVGKELLPDVITEAGKLAATAAEPIDDLRGSAEYRREMVGVCTMRALNMLATDQEREGFPQTPIMLWGPEVMEVRSTLTKPLEHPGIPIETTINGKPQIFEHGHEKTLLRLLREDAGLTGTKEGCAEGECGACTVFLDGVAVMSCMVPAPRAHFAKIVTIEGLAQDDQLHPIQQAFIDEGAVQCGYCTPGFLMSGAKLLEERTFPTQDEIAYAMTGNLCRCTGYYKIISAVERAASLRHAEGGVSPQ
jgi:carbon-monoxide dehydrogenase medium subunit